MKNRITELFGIEYPIIQAGMVWCSGWKLASAVSNAGGLGLIGSGSMYPETLKEHVVKCKEATDKPFGVNVPLLYPDIDKIMKIIEEEQIKIVFTSAGNPTTWTSTLKQMGATVVHVVSSVKFALKSEQSGVDAVVAEGFEAGGHNGREETTSFCLIPSVSEVVKIPTIAAGGIGTGKGMMAAFALGAEGVQIGSRFAVSEESSAHINFKKRIVEAGEGETVLTMKKLTPVRIIKNSFYNLIKDAEDKCVSNEELSQILGRSRAKKGIFEGNLEDGELEIGQISGNIKDILPAREILKNIWEEFISTKKRLKDL
ncbi:MAG TPA: nitronate monooxygenase [Cyclobacteriaceae bacterium]